MKLKELFSVNCWQLSIIGLVVLNGNIANASENCSPKGTGPGESCIYHYQLVVNKNDKLCKQMGEVLNSNFTTLFDYRGFGEGAGVFELANSYPTSKEFEAITWQHPQTYTNDGKNFGSLPVAEFDIDNDGVKEEVIKTLENDGKDYFEELVIYRQKIRGQVLH